MSGESVSENSNKNNKVNTVDSKNLPYFCSYLIMQLSFSSRRISRDDKPTQCSVPRRQYLSGDIPLDFER